MNIHYCVNMDFLQIGVSCMTFSMTYRDLYNWVKLPLMWNVELKTLNCFCSPIYELQFLAQFPHIALTGPSTFLNRYNLTLRLSWRFSMVLLDVKYVAKDSITSHVSQPMI